MKKLFLLATFAIHSFSLILALEQSIKQTQSSAPSKRYNLFFIGESCAGKTTLMQHLCLLSDKFFIPKFTTTRAQRLDDDPSLFEFVTVEQYLKSRAAREFIFEIDDNITYYGYKKNNWHSCNKHALLYGSPYCIEQSKKIENALLILIEADKEKGFAARQDPSEIQEKRRKINKQFSEQFFKNNDFRQKMDFIHYNTFGDPTASADQLLHALQEQFLYN